MKKLLGILVLSLLLSGCATTTQEVVYSGQKSGDIRVGATKFEVGRSFTWSDSDPWGSRGCDVQYFPKTKMEIISSTEFQNIFLVFENVTQRTVQRPVVRYDGVTIHHCSSTEKWNRGNGTLKAWVSTLPAAIQIASGEFAETTEKIVETTKPTKQGIEPYKAMCRNIGYKEGTEKFADCVKDLYLKNLDAKNQNQSISNMTGTPKRKIDPSVWDDLLKMGGITSGSSSSSSSGSLSKPKATCYYTGEETVGHNKSCRYSCTGSIDTITIAAMENCPLHIQR